MLCGKHRQFGPLPSRLADATPPPFVTSLIPCCGSVSDCRMTISANKNQCCNGVTDIYGGMEGELAGWRTRHNELDVMLVPYKHLVRLRAQELGNPSVSGRILCAFFKPRLRIQPASSVPISCGA